MVMRNFWLINIVFFIISLSIDGSSLQWNVSQDITHAFGLCRKLKYSKLSIKELVSKQNCEGGLGCYMKKTWIVPMTNVSYLLWLLREEEKNYKKYRSIKSKLTKGRILKRYILFFYFSSLSPFFLVFFHYKIWLRVD